MTSLSHDAPVQERELIYALDIGTRSVIGMLAVPERDRVRILAMEKQPHTRRAMLDGQIEDIAQVAQAVTAVTRRLEQSAGRRLERACVAAAGRALRTEQGHSVMELSAPEVIGEERIGQLEAAAVAEAEQVLRGGEDQEQRLFLVGYTATQFLLDHYPMTNLRGHTGKRLEAGVVATFLPSEVIDSLYAVMREAGLEVSSLTLEPIAALNAAIPADLRLLNLALVDIGAGTSDIAICRDGNVVGYTMATVAGDEMTEALMRAFLVDYPTAERMKAELASGQPVRYTDILGLEQTAAPQELTAALEGAAQKLVEEIAQRVSQLNGGAPSALFLAGGGSKLADLGGRVADALGMDRRRVAIAGGHFKSSAYSDTLELEDPEYTTPLGIAISAGLGLISDSYRVRLNGAPAKLFRSGRLTVLELLMMNGYTYGDLLGRNGRSLTLQVDGRRRVFHGEPAVPAQLRVNGTEAQPSLVIHAGDQIEFVPAQAGKDRVLTAGELIRELGADGILIGGRTPEPEEPVSAGSSVETVVFPHEPVPLSEGPAPREAEAERAEAAAAAEERPAPPAAEITFNGRPMALPAKPDGVPCYLMDLLKDSGIDFKHLDRPVILRVNGRECTSFQQVINNHDEVEIRYAEQDA